MTGNAFVQKCYEVKGPAETKALYGIYTIGLVNCVKLNGELNIKTTLDNMYIIFQANIQNISLL